MFGIEQVNAALDDLYASHYWAAREERPRPGRPGVRRDPGMSLRALRRLGAQMASVRREGNSSTSSRSITGSAPLAFERP